MANSLYPDQARQPVRPDLGSNCLQRVYIRDIELIGNDNFIYQEERAKERIEEEKRMAEQRKEEEVKRKAEEVSMVDLNQSSFSLNTYEQ